MDAAERLEVLPEDWERGLAVVAHPDDMEYGAASTVARWTSQGKDIRYVLVTKGEAGIRSMPPSQVGPLRMREQRASCAEVGVSVVEFLGHGDGLVQESIKLRRDLALAIRRHRPDVVVSINHHDSWGGRSWNHADHRAVGRSLLDATRDAANPWIHDGEPDPWDGTRFVAFSGSPHPTHATDITEHIERGISSLRCHGTYLENLDGGMPDIDSFLRGAAAENGPSLGVDLATTFEVIEP